MNSTKYPCQKGHKINEDEEISKLHCEIENLRACTKKALERSYEDYDRIRNEIHFELEKNHEYEQQMRRVKENHFSSCRQNEVKGISDLLKKHVVGNDEIDVQQSLTKHFRLLFATENNGGHFFQRIIIPGNHPDLKNNDLCNKKSTKTSRDTFFCFKKMNRLKVNMPKPTVAACHKWICRKNVECRSFGPGLPSPNYPENIQKSSLLMKEILVQELLNEIKYFQQSNKVTFNEFKKILKEKDILVENLEKKVEKQQVLIKNIHDDIEKVIKLVVERKIDNDFEVRSRDPNLDLIQSNSQHISHSQTNEHVLLSSLTSFARFC